MVEKDRQPPLGKADESLEVPDATEDNTAQAVTYSPRMDGGLSFLSLLPLLSAGASSSKSAIEISRLLKDLPTFQIAITDSRASEFTPSENSTNIALEPGTRVHEVTIRIRNNSIHGIYVENLSVTCPGRDHEAQGFVVIIPEVRSHWSTSPSKALSHTNVFPIYLPPERHLESETQVTIAFPLLQPQSFHESSPFMNAQFTVSHLDQKKVEPKNFSFRVRWI